MVESAAKPARFANTNALEQAFHMVVRSRNRASVLNSGVEKPWFKRRRKNHDACVANNKLDALDRISSDFL